MTPVRPGGGRAPGRKIGGGGQALPERRELGEFPLPMERQGNPRAHARSRRWTAGLLTGIAVLLAVIALVVTYLGRAVLRPEPFADRAVAALRDPAVRDDVADQLTAVVVTRVGGGDLVAVRPLIRSAAGVIVGSKAFAALFRRAVLVAHNAVVEDNGRTLRLTIGDLGVLVQGPLQKFAPGVAATIARQQLPALVSYRPDGRVLDAVRAAKRAYSVAWLLALLAVLATAGGLAVSPSRRRTARQLGIGLLIGGLAIAAVLTVGRTIAADAAAPGAERWSMPCGARSSPVFGFRRSCSRAGARSAPHAHS